MAEDLSSHLLADHGHQAGGFLGVRLLHQVIDTADGVLWVIVHDDREDPEARVTARLGLESRRLAYLSTDHTMDHD